MRRDVLGALLAGGGSRRFGAAKALAPFLGAPMARWPLQILSGLCREVVIVTHLSQVARRLGCRAIEDRVPDAGPLAGLHSALASGTPLAIPTWFCEA